MMWYWFVSWGWMYVMIIMSTIRRFEEQLKEHDFSYPVESHIYGHIGHLLIPFQPYSTKLFREERKDPVDCAADRKESWKDTLRFLKEKW